MGVYLSKPNKEKISTNHENNFLKCGASSMQGWRVSQEDAHNCCLDFDKEVSLFAVYDGHGGHEVAEYASLKLPEFIRETSAYKNGDLENALKDAFLAFDATLTLEPVLTELKRIASDKKSSGDNAEGEAETEDEACEDDVRDLKEEANMPLAEVMARYANGTFPKTPSLRRLSGESSKPKSPFLRARTLPSTTSDSEVSSSSSGTSGIAVESGCSSTGTDAGISSSNVSGGGCSTSTSSSAVSSVSGGNVVTNGVGEEEGSVTEEPAKPAPSVQVGHHCSSTGTDGGISSSNESGGGCSTSTSSGSGGNVVTNRVGEEEGSVTEEPAKPAPSAQKGVLGGDNEVTSSSTPVNGEAGSNCSSKDKKTGEETAGSASQRKARRRAVAMFRSIMGHMSDSSEESDENDETFNGTAADTSANHSDEDEDEEEEGESGEDEEESSEEDEEPEEAEEELEDEEDMCQIKQGEELPGCDSGCTAVVTLMAKDRLVVANAGDSRAVLCRGGQAVDLSVDHKPEDPLELKRINGAGGKVTSDGRVNGGLNLSRALGDHMYKQTIDLNPTEQMITALPDVKALPIQPEDEFVVLACDGIWNSMSSQEVVDFVRPLVGSHHLSAICEKLFDHCLAENTVGDGTGCDNMTCVIVQLLHNKGSGVDQENAKNSVETMVAGVGSCTAKRKLTSEESSSSENKKPRTSDEEEEEATSAETTTADHQPPPL